MPKSPAPWNRKKIGEILVELKVLTRSEVEQVLRALGQRDDFTKFGQVAREMGFLREEHILAALAVQMELLPRIQDMSVGRILERLRKPVSGLQPRPNLGK